MSGIVLPCNVQCLHRALRRESVHLFLKAAARNPPSPPQRNLLSLSVRGGAERESTRTLERQHYRLHPSNANTTGFQPSGKIKLTCPFTVQQLQRQHTRALIVHSRPLGMAQSDTEMNILFDMLTSGQFVPPSKPTQLVNTLANWPTQLINMHEMTRKSTSSRLAKSVASLGRRLVNRRRLIIPARSRLVSQSSQNRATLLPWFQWHVELGSNAHPGRSNTLGGARRE